MKNISIAMMLGITASIAGIALKPTAAHAANLSYTGTFGTNPDAIESFFFTADGTSTVTIRSYGYGGSGAGRNAAGNTIAAGGFDPVLTLFNGTTGAYVLDRDDDIGLDFNLVQRLDAGSYRAVLSVGGNYAVGAYPPSGSIPAGNFSQGFTGGTSFFGQTPNYAFDILNVNNAATAVPEPFTIVGTMIGAATALKMRKRLKATNKL